ncbi:hypothetical protein GF362_00345 [Candidatus Dojkabacteria bacterium]|nr:hypothetical protein [Candidatus Dojkabacteria bacterium]
MNIKTYTNIEPNKSVTLLQFQKDIGRYDLTSTLMSLQRLSALMSNQVWVNLNLEFEFFSNPKIVKSILLSRDFVSFAAKQAILSCSDSDMHYNDLDLVNLVYNYGNLDIDLGHTNPESKDSWLTLLRGANQQWHYLRLPYMVVGRYVYLLDKIRELNKGFYKEIKSINGLDLEDIFYIGVLIFSGYINPRENFLPYFDLNRYINTDVEKWKQILTKEKIEKFLDIFTTKPESFKKVNEKFELKNVLLKKFEFNPLKRYPVIKTDSSRSEEMYIIPSLPDFIYACFEGIYYVMLDTLDDKKKDKLFETFGKAFEEYTGDLLQYNNVDLFSRAELVKERCYTVSKKSWKSADWILVSENIIVQIECKKRKLDNYSRAGVQHDKDYGIDSFLKDTAGQLDKLDEKASHIKDGLVGDIKYQNQKFLNIIVYLDEMFTIDKYGRSTIEENMESNGKKTNFHIVGCYEFELICEYVRRNSIDFSTAVEDILGDRSDGIKSIKMLDDIFQSFFSRIR